MTSFLSPSPDRRRWLSLAVVCLAQLMIVLDATIVTVALPQIQHDLHFSQSDLTWVVNAFLVTFGSFLLLAGRLGDLVGRKRVFMAGVTLFTAASVLCGAAWSSEVLVIARFIQGVGAALQASVILAIIVTEFPAPAERAKAMSAYVFVAVAGGSLGLLLGGILTEALDWHWIFFVNVPIGLATVATGRRLIPSDPGIGLRHGIDWLGSVLVTASMMAGVYGIVESSTDGWGSLGVLAPLAGAVVLMAAFLALESRIDNPIMPLRILRLRGLIGSSVVRAAIVTTMYSTFFLGTLYLEHVRHFTALQAGLAFMPWTLTVAALSLGITARLVARFGPMRVLLGGMASVVIGIGLIHGAGPTTPFFPTVFFAFFAIGLGIGLAFMPLLQIAMADVPPADAGLGSGIVNVSQQIAGALGLAVLGTIATSHSKALLAAHHTAAAAQVGGDHVAYVVGAAVVIAGMAIALAWLRPSAAAEADGLETPLEADPLATEPVYEDVFEVV